MKTFLLGFLLLMWMFFTLILSLSVIGWVALLPVPNNTMEHMEMTDGRRSTWMLIGLNIKRKLLE